jgi:hypothetical protein
MTEPSTNDKAYEAIALAYVRSFTKLIAARAGQLALELALLSFRSRPYPPEPTWPAEWKEVLKGIESISVHEYDSFKYVGDFGHLVFATTLLDSFLVDTTRFLFLLLPESIGKAQGITVNDIVSAKSVDDLLVAAVEKRARDLSYKSFLERLDFLETHFGIPIKLDSDVKSEIEHYSGIRNVIIHDQAFYNLKRDGHGQIVLDVHSCPVHPRPVDGKQIGGAIAAYVKVAASVATGVFEHVLKVAAPSFLAVTAQIGEKHGAG